MSGMPILSIRSLCKSFLFGHRQAVQRREALRGVDLDVEQGEILGIVGDKGCGKTTLLLCTAGLLRCDSGCIHWYGKRFVGGGRLPDLVYVPAVPTYYPFLTVRDVLSRHARRESVRFGFARAIEDLSQRVSLCGRLSTSVAALESSELKLLALAQAIIEEPKVILLDGTLDGLDDRISVVRQAIEEKATHGAMLIVSSRQASVVGRTATRIVVMDAGRIAGSFSAEGGAIEPRNPSVAFTDVGARVRQIAERVH
jgi:ABC-type multidrug transport system ATPase subunit